MDWLNPLGGVIMSSKLRLCNLLFFFCEADNSESSNPDVVSSSSLSVTEGIATGSLVENFLLNGEFLLSNRWGTFKLEMLGFFFKGFSSIPLSPNDFESSTKDETVDSAISVLPW